MTDKEAVKKVDSVFSAITNAKTLNNLKAILNGDKLLQKKQQSTDKYPRLMLEITPEEIKGLEECGILNEVGELREGETALEKLFYAYLWKRGDLAKLKHIVAGIKGDSVENRKSGFVLEQFGKHLRSKEEPIIDQHVLRAFGAYKCNEGGSDFTEIRKLQAITKKHRPLIDNYKKWINGAELKESLKEDGDYRYQIDQILFALGKLIKIN